MSTATKTNTEATVKEKQPPIHKARIGALQLAIWENRAVDTKGEERVYKTATLERGYTDKEGEWVNEKLQMNSRVLVT